VGAASLEQRPEGNFQAPEEWHILDLASEDVAPTALRLGIGTFARLTNGLHHRLYHSFG